MTYEVVSLRISYESYSLSPAFVRAGATIHEEDGESVELRWEHMPENHLQILRAFMQERGVPFVIGISSTAFPCVRCLVSDGADTREALLASGEVLVPYGVPSARREAKAFMDLHARTIDKLIPRPISTASNGEVSETG